VERLLITLLIRLGVIASVASIAVRYPPFRRALLRETRTFREQFHFAFWFGGVFGLLSCIRVVSVHGYEALDLGLEGSLLAGLLGGYAPGLIAGILISIPGMWKAGEWLTLPLFAGIGVMGGLLRDFVSDPEEIWRLSPFIDLNVWRALKGFKFFPVAFALAVFSAEFLRQALGHSFPGRIFLLPTAEDAPHKLSVLLLYLAAFAAITLPLKVWNNTRNEIKLEQQKNLLMEARLQALTSQINPHFLFNTLNSVSSLIRTNPEQARVMILKLSRILRRLLRKHEHLSPLRDELDFIDDYLSIEQIRFGGKLRFEKHIEPCTMDMLVPSMLLQPLVENCIKHGLSRKVEGGTIVLRARRERSMLYVSVEDDGVGISQERLSNLKDSGIGVNNVSERLKVLFGEEGLLRIESEEGGGTRVEIQVPEQLSIQSSVVSYQSSA
jgi:two-component system LytT family sensor kinase